MQFHDLKIALIMWFKVRKQEKQQEYNLKTAKTLDTVSGPCYIPARQGKGVMSKDISPALFVF